MRLSDKDRERLGAPEEIDTSNRITVLEAEAIEELLGIDSTTAIEWMAPHREELPDGTLRFRLKPKGVRLMVWLGLHRAGVQVPFEELTFDYMPFIGWFERQAQQELGKAQSATGAAATPSKSRTTGRGTRSRTSKT